MPVCLTSSFTFNASARLVENVRIIGTLIMIPPPLRQRPLGSSNGGPQTLLKVKSMHKFCFPCFSYIRESLSNIFTYQIIGAFTGHREQPVHVEGDLIVRARLQFGRHGLSPILLFKTLKTSPSLTSKRHSW